MSTLTVITDATAAAQGESGGLSCKFPGCKAENIGAKRAFVPQLQAIKKIVGRPVRTSDLANHVHCRKHAAAAREQGIKMFAYDATVAELQRRERERETGLGHFSMYEALRKALK